MIQSFRIATDDLTTFLTVVRGIIENTFNKESSKYSQLYLTTEQSMMFRDGKKWIGDDKELLRNLGVKSLGASDERGWSKPNLFFRCSIADYKSDMVKDDQAIPFNDYNLLMERICVLITDDPNQKRGLEPQFREKCGSGYNYAFNTMDGDIGVGYYATYRPNGGWDIIDIALCHMYYGK